MSTFWPVIESNSLVYWSSVESRRRRARRSRQVMARTAAVPIQTWRGLTPIQPPTLAQKPVDVGSGDPNVARLWARTPNVR